MFKNLKWGLYVDVETESELRNALELSLKMQQVKLSNLVTTPLEIPSHQGKL